MRPQYKFFVAIGAFLAWTGYASAQSYTGPTFLQSYQPLYATASQEDLIFTYSSGANIFTVSNLFFGSTSSNSPNLLSGPGAFAPYTSSTQQPLSGSGSISELVSTVPGGTYKFSYDLGNNLASIGFSPVPVSAVPLPAAFPLFAISLTVLGFISWRFRRGTDLISV